MEKVLDQSLPCNIKKRIPETVRGLHLLLYVWNHLPSPFQCLQISLAEMLWAVGVSIQNRLISPVSSQCALRRAHSDSPQSIRIHRWCRIMPTLTMVEGKVWKGPTCISNLRSKDRFCQIVRNYMAISKLENPKSVGFLLQIHKLFNVYLCSVAWGYPGMPCLLLLDYMIESIARLLETLKFEERNWLDRHQSS